MLLRHFSSCPFVPWFSTERLHSSSEFQCCWNVVFSSYLPWVFPCPLAHIILFLGLPPCDNFTMAYHWTMTFTPSSFCCILLFITICHTDFYSLVLCSTLIYYLSLSCPLLHYWVQCIPAMHVVFLPCNSWALTSLSYCSVLDYLFISQIISFLPSTLLLWAFSCVLLWHRLEFLQSQVHWLPQSPPTKHLQQPYWLTPYYGDFSPPTLFPVWTPFWG